MARITSGCAPLQDEMDEDGEGSVDFDEFFEWWKKNKDRKSGIFASAKEGAERKKQDKLKRIEAQVRTPSHNMDYNPTRWP